jgi:uncharacterized membrane protein YagU involved in acid resistance
MNRYPQRMIAGAIAGFVATAPMSAVMLRWHRRLPWRQQEPLPPEQVTANVLDAAGLDDDLSRPQIAALAVLNHFGYGATVGSIYGLLTSGSRPVSPLLNGVAYGLGIWGASYLGLLPALGLYRSATEEPAERNLLMLSAHVVWGGALGVVTEIAERRARRRSEGNESIPDATHGTSHTHDGAQVYQQPGNI